MQPSTVFFGLRTNAHQLIAGAGIGAVRRRIKICALLHDFVVLEPGWYALVAGNKGYANVPHPSDQWPSKEGPSAPDDWKWILLDPSNPFRVQTPWSRASSLSLRPMMDVGSPVLNWAATFAPFYREIPANAGWLRWGWPPGAGPVPTAWTPKLLAERERFGHRVSGELWRLATDAHASPPQPADEDPTPFDEDVDDPVLLKQWTDRHVRTAIAREACKDLAAAASSRFVISVDDLHRGMLIRRIDRGVARRVLGGRAFDVVEPRQLSWGEIGELREMTGFAEYRAILRDLEAQAVEAGGPNVDMRILRSYGDALAKAASRLPSRRTRLGVATIGLVMGEVVGAMAGVPAVGGVTGAVLGGTVAEIAQGRVRPPWLAIHSRLRSPAERRPQS